MLALPSFWHFSPIPIFGSISDASQLPCCGEMVPQSVYFFFGLLKYLWNHAHLASASVALMLDGALYLRGFLES